MFNRSASLAMSTSVLKALPGEIDIERHSPSILYVFKLPPINTIISDILKMCLSNNQAGITITNAGNHFQNHCRPLDKCMFSYFSTTAYISKTKKNV